MINSNNAFFSYDSLTIYDGGSSTSTMMGKYCGDLIPPTHISSINEIFIRFHSDGSVTRAGFEMEYNPTGNLITSIQNNTDCFGNVILGILVISCYIVVFFMYRIDQNCHFHSI